MLKIIGVQDIAESSWTTLLKESSVATWFQTSEAYLFFDGLSFLDAFCLAVENDGRLKGVIIGYIQKDGGRLKQFFSRRAIITGGPLLADDITEEELMALLHAVNNQLKHKVIFIETRNFNDYSKWQMVFQRCGFEYEPHLNYHVDCTDWDEVEKRIGKHRRRYIRLSIKNGASIVESPNQSQVHEFYTILYELYSNKVKSSLFPVSFFDQLFKIKTCKYVLIEFEGRIVGGSVCVFLDNRAVYEWFACGKDGAYKNIYPSSLTKYAGMRFTYNNGYRVFDMMGAGKPNEYYGVRDFKSEFGGELVEYGRFLFVENRLLYFIGEMGVKIIKILK